MSVAVSIPASKDEHGENFPVASLLIAPRLRQPILAFYRFARAADDVADHPALSPREKFEGLDALEETLLGKSDAAPQAFPLRRVLAERNLPPAHALDLLTAFRMDVDKLRYANWDELMHYCRYSATPVGRFVLDLHSEEANRVWPPSDALCSALQVINHLQDCAKDYRALDRVYLPLDMLGAHGARVEDLSASQSSPQLRAAILAITEQTASLMPEASKLPLVVNNARLGLETGIIVRLATRLISLLKMRDPLSERVHLSKPGAAWQALQAAAATLVARQSGSGLKSGTRTAS